ncbi:MAG TPA: hypothetical protein VJA46_00260 [Acidimicrobiia bacterium]|nr:hypothetical protein [Acidimicrobiia bacterium]
MRRLRVVMVVLASASVAGCSSSDGESTVTTVPVTVVDATTTTEPPTTTSSGTPTTTVGGSVGTSEETQAYCDSFSIYLAAAEAAASVGDAALLNTDEVNLAAAEIEDHMVAECGYQTVFVTAVDYSYEGALSDLESGIVAIEFTNAGAEAHQLAIVRINDDVTASAAEILALPPEEGGTMVTFYRDVLLLPSNYDTTFVDLDAGRYIYFCPIPQGATPENIAATESGEMEAGPPHFTLGEVAEVTVADS